MCSSPNSHTFRLQAHLIARSRIAGPQPSRPVNGRPTARCPCGSQDFSKRVEKLLPKLAELEYTGK